MTTMIIEVQLRKRRELAWQMSEKKDLDGRTDRNGRLWNSG